MSVRATPATTLGTISIESGQAVLILVGGVLFAAGTVSAPVLLVFLFLTLTIYQPIQELTVLVGYRRSQQNIAARVAEIWDAPVLEEPPTASAPFAPHGTAVAFDDVTFSYVLSDAPALAHASFTADEGAVTALVGRSGSGKSTIAHLIARFWDVDAGSVSIGGADVREIGSAGVLDAVAMVEQDVFLFDATVRLNVTLGRPEANDDEIWAALRDAQCDDVVAALPDGLDTELTENGADLSGGQRQRLAIARALLKDSPVVILDEAASAVDPGTEERIQEALSRLMRGRTVIVIAHRISTVTAAHRIVVVDDGRVVATGTHAALLES